MLASCLAQQGGAQGLDLNQIGGSILGTGFNAAVCVTNDDGSLIAINTEACDFTGFGETPFHKAHLALQGERNVCSEHYCSGKVLPDVFRRAVLAIGTTTLYSKISNVDDTTLNQFMFAVSYGQDHELTEKFKPIEFEMIRIIAKKMTDNAEYVYSTLLSGVSQFATTGRNPITRFLVDGSIVQKQKQFVDGVNQRTGRMNGRNGSLGLVWNPEMEVTFAKSEELYKPAITNSVLGGILLAHADTVRERKD